MNIFFKLPSRRLYICTFCDKNVRNQIDYFLTNRRYRNILKSVKIYPDADINSDHNFLLAKLNIKLKKIHKHLTFKGITMGIIQQETIKDRVRTSLSEKLKNIKEKYKQ